MVTDVLSLILCFTLFIVGFGYLFSIYEKKNLTTSIFLVLMGTSLAVNLIVLFEDYNFGSERFYNIIILLFMIFIPKLLSNVIHLKATTDHTKWSRFFFSVIIYSISLLGVEYFLSTANYKGLALFFLFMVGIDTFIFSKLKIKIEDV